MLKVSSKIMEITQIETPAFDFTRYKDQPVPE